MRTELDSFYDKQLKTKIIIAYSIVIILFGLLCLRLWFLQVIKGNDYRKLSENNRIRVQKIPAPRGLVLDNKGRVLAGNRPSFDICLVPQETRNLEVALKHLAGLLGCDLSRLKQKVEGSRDSPPFEPIKLKTDVSRDALGLILTHKLELPGIVVESIPVRDYPYGTLACHLLGYLGEIGPRELARTDFSSYKLGDFIGKCGVEQTMELQMRGFDGGYQAEVDAAGYKINIMGRVDPVPAANIVLTINVDLQRAAEVALGNRPGALIVIDPRNGHILAMVSSPAFDPNLFSRGISLRSWDDIVNNPEHLLINRCIQAAYPPGSTYKLVTAVAALEEGLVKPDTEFFCGGSFRCGNRTYGCWKKSGHGKVSLMKGIVESCDVYFYNLGSLLEPNLLAKYARSFGFGLPTGSTLNDEKSGLVPTTDWYQSKYGIPWQPGDNLSTAIGQGSNQVTPLQLVMAYASIANGGVLYKPIYIDKIVSPNGEIIKQFVPSVRGEVQISQENLTLLKECLSGAVNSPSGTGWKAQLPHIDIAGKTGTAQVISARREGLRSSKDKFVDHSWFVAFAPKDEARVAVVVLVEHGGHGGSTAAPIAKEVIAKFFDLEGSGNV